MKLNNLSLKAKLTLLSGLFVTGMLVFGVVAFTTLNEVKIGGPIYTAVNTATTIDGEVSPPTGYLVSARVLIFQMLNDGAHDPVALNTLRESFEVERKRFEETHQEFERIIPEGHLKDLMQKAYEPGHQYLETAEAKFIPLMLAGKLEEANAARPELKALFLAHATANKEFDETNMVRIAELEKESASEVASRTYTLIAVAVAMMVLVLALCFIIAKGITTPMAATLQMLHQVSLGNLTHRMEVDGRDEIAQMGNALNDTIDNLSRVMAEIDTDAKVLSTASEKLSATSMQLGDNSQHTTDQAAAVSSAAEEVSQNVQTVSAATEEMSASIKEISKNASEAAEVASSAARLAGATTATMTKLSESSAEIGNVIKVITSIAEQTNLLALNATIEAARAGEAGKGFAVVANEVKELAKETAKATEDIGAKVEAIQHDAKGAVQAIDEITTVIGRINDIQNTIASAVEEQTGTTNEISRNVSETAKGSSDIASNITGVASSAKATHDCAAIAENSAAALARVAASLTGVVGQFQLSNQGRLGNVAGTSH